MKPKTLAAAATACALLAAPTTALGAKSADAPASALAASTPFPQIVGSPGASFFHGDSFYTMGVVVRFDRVLPKTGARVVIGPDVKSGQDVGSVYGGDTPHRIGVNARHCYTIEVGRPRPVSTPKVGARWKVGLIRSRGTVDNTAAATLRAGDVAESQARKQGCFHTTESSSLIGQRREVLVKQLLIYRNPAKSYINSLQRGESFKIERVSPTKTYAYGFAYGKLNRHAWVRLRGLTPAK